LLTQSLISRQSRPFKIWVSLEIYAAKRNT